MAQTTTQVNACDVSIWLDNASGTLVDVSGSTNQCSLTLTLESGVTRTFGTKWPARQNCAKDAKIALSIVYSEASGEAMEIWKNWFFANSPGARTVHIYVPDKNVGSDNYYGEFVIDGDAEIPLEAGTSDPIVVSVNLAVTGQCYHVINAT